MELSDIPKSIEEHSLKPFLFSGSFDPWTYGHESVVRDFFELFPEKQLIIMVADNPLKKSLFSPQQRKYMIEQSLISWGSKVSVEIYNGVVSNYAYENGVQAIIKGVRDTKDFEYELAISQANKYFSGNVKTLLIPQIDSESQKVSSSVTKILQSYGADISPLVSPMVREALRMKTRNQMLVGVTGGTGSGKSTLCRAISEYSQTQDIPVHTLDVDTLVYDLYQKPNSSLTHQIRQEMLANFPPEIIDGDDTVNRRVLGDIVFSDSEKKIVLEKILGEAFLYMLSQTIQNITTPGIILLDWALFVEYNKTDICDENMILVGVPEETQKERILARDSLSDIQASKRMRHQVSYVQRKKSIQDSQKLFSDRFFLETNGILNEREETYNILTQRYRYLQAVFSE